MMKFGPVTWVSLLIAALIIGTNAYAQREHELPPPQEESYGARFFDQLRLIFGRFRNTDLQRAFQTAGPIRCADLVNGKGEWRDVAFFNENRRFGDWYRTTLLEVKSDLVAYIFKGPCRDPRGPVQVTTKFPVYESVKAYQEKKISFQEIDVNVNAPVTAYFNPEAQAYTFDLPYLFRVTNGDGETFYSLNPRHLSDEYATDVKIRWECKEVTGDDVTYQFLICHTTLIPRDALAKDEHRISPFGASAYSILSDGKEASSAVKLTFGAPVD
jgi:hypothetical protein